MKIKLTLSDVFRRSDEPECQLLIQALAVISTQTGFSAMTPDQVFSYVKAQAEEVTSETN